MIIVGGPIPRAGALGSQSSASLQAGRDFPYNREFHLRLT
jgi:hypothetical protein